MFKPHRQSLVILFGLAVPFPFPVDFQIKNRSFTSEAGENLQTCRRHKMICSFLLKRKSKDCVYGIWVFISYVMSVELDIPS